MVETEDLVDSVGCEVRRRSRLRLGKEVPQEYKGGVCHFDVVLFEYLFRGLEREVVGLGYGETVVRRFSDGGLSSGRVEEFPSNFVHLIVVVIC